MIGLNQPLLQLPGNNLEYNASRGSVNRKAVPNTSSGVAIMPVPIPADGKGSCTLEMGRKCHDYAGPGLVAADDGVKADQMEQAAKGESMGTGPMSNSSLTASSILSDNRLAVAAVASPSSAPIPDAIGGGVSATDQVVATVTVTRIVNECSCPTTQVETKRRLRSD